MVSKYLFIKETDCLTDKKSLLKFPNHQIRMLQNPFLNNVNDNDNQI